MRAAPFRFAEGLKLLAQRAELMDRACRSTSGGMASVLSGDPEVIREVCAACGIDVANFNSPGQIVISGEKEKLAEAVEELKNRGMRKVIVLNVAGAFHSRLMAPAGEALKPVLEATPMTVPAVPVYHNYTAAPAKDAAELRGEPGCAGRGLGALGGVRARHGRGGRRRHDRIRPRQRADRAAAPDAARCAVLQCQQRGVARLARSLREPGRGGRTAAARLRENKFRHQSKGKGFIDEL